MPRGQPVTARALIAIAIVVAATAAIAQTGSWYPSRWGAADQRGAANRITPAKVLEAKNLITRGAVYQLGRTYEAGMPMVGTRQFSLRIPYVFRPPGSNQPTYHDEIISGELGQVGTQFASLSHFGIGDLFYNGNNRNDFATAEGMTRLGVEHVGALTTRGVLIDVAAFKGVPQLAGGYEISAADLQGALTRQSLEIRAGDIVLIHTGCGGLWMKDNATFVANAPGIGMAAAQFLVGEEVVMVGSDTWAVEVVPNPDASLAFPVHQIFLTRNGIYIFENLATEELARDNAYEFAFFFAPLKLKGATGSPGNPIAIR